MSRRHQLGWDNTHGAGCSYRGCLLYVIAIQILPDIPSNSGHILIVAHISALQMQFIISFKDTNENCVSSWELSPCALSQLRASAAQNTHKDECLKLLPSWGKKLKKLSFCVCGMARPTKSLIVKFQDLRFLPGLRIIPMFSFPRNLYCQESLTLGSGWLWFCDGVSWPQLATRWGHQMQILGPKITPPGAQTAAIEISVTIARCHIKLHFFYCCKHFSFLISFHCSVHRINNSPNYNLNKQ